MSSVETLKKKKVLMICLGNICRSPIAEAVFQNEVNKRGLQDYWKVESAAIIGFHVGKKPDNRALDTLMKNGITDYSHKARQIELSDFYIYDWIFGMDQENIKDLINRRPNLDCRAKVELLGSYNPSETIIIRDPYYDSGSAGFQKAYDQCVTCITAFLDKHSN
ncbi:PREDICTED: low molecular weight phosphotyrosine protein phosphatase-like [Cyphomyrmex costatus]|uniref:Low molecular weight phosphotyrosine protein phosphatase n=1 Tax=Cyphomyrmex costatus TaxID=456900 RepID=A0A195C9P6_9HYME|nr:PREDICTED: low molecular weight phosphotyrosine protein phosphatase-like [Cyphomyrmex costatus]KYM97542.1 Low molecular weight phosphotyrosine protein phosphatase [Cyphomyrmex costatus]